VLTLLLDGPTAGGAASTLPSATVNRSYPLPSAPRSTAAPRPPTPPLGGLSLTDTENDDDTEEGEKDTSRPCCCCCPSSVAPRGLPKMLMLSVWHMISANAHTRERAHTRET
jgi:hypothetical protein